MKFDFTTPKTVKVTMLKYVNEIVESWDKAYSELDDRYEVVLVARGLLLQHLTTYSKLMRM